MSVIFEQSSKFICRILLNNPAKRNAIDKGILRQLGQALLKFNRDDNLQVAILGGIQGNFCSGYDLNSIVDKVTGEPRLDEIEELLWPLGTRLSDQKITIAAIEGHAVGFGYELALKCDFRVADKDARMGFLNRRFGIPIMNGGTVILPQLVGLSRAIDLVATGRAQLAQEALQYGILSHVSDIGCCFGRADNLARSLLKFNSHALGNDLNSLYSAGAVDNQMELLRGERERSLRYLEQCGPLETAVKFLKGQLCRHGSTDMGTVSLIEPQVTL